MDKQEDQRTENNLNGQEVGRIDAGTAGGPGSGLAAKILGVSGNHRLDGSQWGFAKTGAKPQALSLSSLWNGVLSLSHTVHEVFTVTPVAQRKEGRVHSQPGFEDGPAAHAAWWPPSSPAPSPPTPSRRVPIMAKQGLLMCSIHTAHFDSDRKSVV